MKKIRVKRPTKKDRLIVQALRLIDEVNGGNTVFNIELVIPLLSGWTTNRQTVTDRLGAFERWGYIKRIKGNRGFKSFQML